MSQTLPTCCVCYNCRAQTSLEVEQEEGPRALPVCQEELAQSIQPWGLFTEGISMDDPSSLTPSPQQSQPYSNSSHTTHGWASQETELSVVQSTACAGSNLHGFEDPHVTRETQKHAGLLEHTSSND